MNTTRTTLTELEGATLAIIKRRGPCTAYVVKEAFRTSPSDFWSGSAGAVYPLVKRLETRGLITSVADKHDGRSRREFSITRQGNAALVAWLSDAEKAANQGFDPLRTRLLFSDLMPESTLKKFVADTQELMDQDFEIPTIVSPDMIELHETWSGLRSEALKAFSSSLKK